MTTETSRAELPRTYTPGDTEPDIRERWSSAGLGRAEPPTDGQASYAIVIPPPNVTSALHLGHALNNTLQDILVRYHRLRGEAVLWMPGTDHAGIATQTVVEKRLLMEGRRRIDMDREEFIDVARQWKDQYEEVILGQLREIGSSCDWSRTRFTMDPVCTKAVREAFFRLFDDGLIYRGKRLVNWDPVSRTALADDEVEMVDVPGHMWYLQYPLSDGDGHVTVATTRPETMLGDTAVAINPADPRAQALRGRTVQLPIVGREIPIIEDDYVVMPGSGDDPKAEFATGFLKVTPAHDPNDWDIGLRHDLPVINVMAPDATISDAHGWTDVPDAAKAFVGLSREDARIAIVEWFKNDGLLESIRDYSHAVGHSYRSHVPIEPYLSDQWYVRVTDDRLAGEALRAMDPEQVENARFERPGGTDDGDGGLRFTPPRYAKTFQAWHENLRDWCISRQLWWGHRIPVWTLERPLDEAAVIDRSGTLCAPPSDCALPMCNVDDDGLAMRLSADEGDGVVRILACVAADRSDLEDQLTAAGFEQDEDVLDTWFSSALWPMSTMGWPDPAAWDDLDGLLDAFNPTSVLCTAREIITLWVSRMVMFNRYFLDGRLPFTDVYIHPMVQDGHGQKMSKSLGNGVDPRDIVHSHGTDALRLSMAQIATSTQDVRLPVDLIDPHSGQTFTPRTIRTAVGHTVAAPVQQSPADASKSMITVYGILQGEEPTDECPLAMNTSSRFDMGRNFANKLWNAARFALGRVDTPAAVADLGALHATDRWMLSRLAGATEAIEVALSRYQFSVVADLLYDLVWRDFCDWYLEAVKPTIGDSTEQQRCLLSVLDAVLRLVHPVCPFVTETLWPHIEACGDRGVPGLSLPSSDVLALAAWPQIESHLRDESQEDQTSRLQSLIGEIRRARSDNDMPSKLAVTLLAPGPEAHLLEVQSWQPLLSAMCRVSAVEPMPAARPSGCITLSTDGIEYLLQAEQAVDSDAQRARLIARRDELSGRIAGLVKRLGNPGYVEKAPPALVEETRGQLEQAQTDLLAVESAIEALP